MMLKKFLLGIVGFAGALAGFFLWSQNDRLNFQSLKTQNTGTQINKVLLKPIYPQTVLVSSAEFQMGAVPQDSQAFHNEKPQHTVTIPKAFEIGIYEVTFEEYDVFAHMTNRPLPDDNGWGRGNRPVINVSWFDAVAYTQWLSQVSGKTYRLPTEAEWEYVARARTTTIYWWGEKVEKNHAQCINCLDFKPSGTTPVGQFKANAFGLYDTAGNVTEWVVDCYQPDFKNPTQHGNPATSLNCPLRTIRGGSWYNDAITLRSSHRSGLPPEMKNNNGGGFRLVREI